MRWENTPRVSLQEARGARDEARAGLSAGNDPSLIKQKSAASRDAQRQNTFEKVSEQYFTKVKKEGLAESTLAKKAWQLDIANRELGSLPIGDISSPIVLKALKKVEARGIYETARRLRSTIGSVCRFAYANSNALRQVFKNAFAQAGLPDFGPHSIRNTVIKWADENSPDWATRKAFSLNLGQSNIGTAIFS